VIGAAPVSTSITDPRRRRAAILPLLERLHRHKDAAYGDAWRKRGEVIAIFANMARKYDRLLVAFDEQRPAATEPLGDTVADLCVYAAKYLTWIADEHPTAIDGAELPLRATDISAAVGPDAVRAVFDGVGRAPSEPPTGTHAAWHRVRRSFEELEGGLMAQATPGAPPDAIPSYERKARLAWDLVQDSSWLLVAIEHDDPQSLQKLRAEVSEMDEAAARS